MTKTKKDINHVLDMMSAYLHIEKEKIGDNGLKQKRIDDAKAGQGLKGNKVSREKEKRK